MDLGDKKNKIAYQITSQKNSPKINDTLNAVKKEQADLYDSIFIFIIGEKQSSYTLNEARCKELNFNKNANIKDIDNLLKDLVTLDLEILVILYELFQREFRQLKIELEPIDQKGNFESSYYNILEKKPATPPLNAIKFLGEPTTKSYDKDLKKMIKLYEKLASVPRVTREILSIIVERGKYEPSWQLNNKFAIIAQTLEKIMRISQTELLSEINILEEATLLSVETGDVGEREVNYLAIDDRMLNDLFNWMNENNLSIRMLLNTMDFKILDN